MPDIKIGKNEKEVGNGCFWTLAVVVSLLLAAIPFAGPFLALAWVAFCVIGVLGARKEKARLESDEETKLRDFDGSDKFSAILAPAGANDRRSDRTAVVDSNAVITAKINPFNAKKIATELAARNAELQNVIDQYGLREAADLQATMTALRSDLAHGQEQLSDLERETDQLRSELVSVRHQAGLQEVGLFDFEHPAESSAALADKLAGLRAQIKAAVSGKTAVTASSTFTFNNSQAEGRKFVKQMSQIMLRAYNAEAENCVKTVRAGNLHTAQGRLGKAKEMITKQGAMVNLNISSAYHSLRLQEMELAARHLQTLQEEKEAARAQREELREQLKAEAEMARQKEKLLKERSQYQLALAALEANGDLEGAERIRARLAETEDALENVETRAANIRMGHVYVISNMGAFGEQMVKIGMTRRLDPMDRVRELGDASVPFRFDVHALFFAQDAVGIETMLHQTFAEQRVNKVNNRKEFFYVSPDRVLQELKAHNVEIVEFRSDAEAEEFRLSSGQEEVRV